MVTPSSMGISRTIFSPVRRKHVRDRKGRGEGQRTKARNKGRKEGRRRERTQEVSDGDRLSFLTDDAVDGEMGVDGSHLVEESLCE